MSRIFRLGSFFGLTAAQLVLFKPERFNELLKCKYTSLVSENLYSLTKELECLRAVLNKEEYKPDYDKLIDDFKLFGYLGFNNETSDGQAKKKIARFYEDSKKLSNAEMQEKYGDYEEPLQIIRDTLTIDVAKAFPGITGTAGVIVEKLYHNIDYLDDIKNKCREAFNNSHIHEISIVGNPMREILKLDKENSVESPGCCSFVNQMYNKVRTARSDVEKNVAYNDLENWIRCIQNEYEAHDIVFTDSRVIIGILDSVYSEITPSRFAEITGLELTEDAINEAFTELDKHLIGGLGFNSQQMGAQLVSDLQHEDTSGWSVKSKERNEKLDALLRIAYMDLQSRKYNVR